MKIFDSLSEKEKKILIKLEEQDANERGQSIDRKFRLRQIPRETGEFLFNLVSSSINSHNSEWKGLEIGGSGGYSTLWQGLALKQKGKGSFISLEIDEKKVQIAKPNLESVGLSDYVTLMLTDAKEYVKNTKIKFNYVFLDAEKEDYLYYLQTLLHKVEPGCIWVADNVISHASDMKEFIDFLDEEKNLKYTILTIGKGLAFIQIQ